MNKYWSKRIYDDTFKLHNKDEKEILNQLRKLYKKSWEKNEKDLSITFNKILEEAEKNEFPTAMINIYSYTRLYEMRNELMESMRELYNECTNTITTGLVNHYVNTDSLINTLIEEVPDNLITQPSKMFTLSQAEEAREVINQIWCDDGKHFSDRIWKDKAQLMETVVQNLQDCIVRGSSHDEFIKEAKNRWNVSFSNAARLVRTELTYVQNQAALKRYIKAGYEKYEYIAEDDERTCSICKPLDGKKYILSAAQVGINMPPMHPFADAVLLQPLINRMIKSNTANIIVGKDKIYDRAMERYTPL